MRVLDLRPWYERSLQRWWAKSRLQAEPGIWSRMAGYFPAVRISRRSPPPERPFIVSVGNLSLGGSGKTPVVGRLAADLATGGLRVAILTRGYGSSLTSPQLVTPDCTGCGDEARLLAAQLSEAGVDVVQSVDRRRGLAYIADRSSPPDCVILEDGFQTAGVGRHLDILILNSWLKDGEGACVPLAGPLFPVGPYREPARAARRADIWLLEDPGDAFAVRESGPLVTAFSRADRLTDAQGRSVEAGEIGDWAALSGIARPGVFETSAAGLVGRAPRLAIRCRDHESYSHRILDRVAAALSDENLDTVVTTAKDWVKLSGRVPEHWRVFLVVQEVRWETKHALPEVVRERMRGQLEGGGT